MKGSEFISDYVHFLYYKCLKINPNCGRSYKIILIRQQNSTINPINKKDNKCFKYAVTVMINYDVIKRDPQRITKIKPFINKYYWEKIDFPSGKDDWKKFEKIM